MPHPANAFGFPAGMRRAVFLVLALIFAALSAGCNTAGNTLQVERGGQTDDPADGFANIQPGSEQDFIMTVGRRVYFRAASAELDDVARETLDLQAQWLKQYPQWLVKLQGHADDSSAGLTNLSLSERRASAVLDYLVSRGVEPRRLWAKGYGTERLVRDCDSKACKALNRRVVVNLRRQYDESAPQFQARSG